MNRNQKIAITFGAAAIALLVLFPPWIIQSEVTDEVEPWSLTHGRAWIGSPPESPFTRLLQGMPDAPRVAEFADRVRNEWGTPQIDWSAWLPCIAAALCLTAAAALLLKERER